MKQLKRTLSLLLALALCLSLLGVSAFASEEPAEEAAAQSEAVEEPSAEEAAAEESAEAEGTIEAEEPAESGEPDETEAAAADGTATDETTTDEITADETATDETVTDETATDEVSDGEAEEPEASAEAEEPETECICTEQCEAANPDCPVCATEDGALYDCEGGEAEAEAENADTDPEAGIATAALSEGYTEYLQETIDEYTPYLEKTDTYTADSLAELKATLDYAQTVLDNAASYEEYDQRATSAAWDIQSAVNRLVLISGDDAADEDDSKEAAGERSIEE